MATESDPGGRDTSDPKPTSPPWWQDPNARPSWYPANAPWPPPLGPGQSYGDRPGQINDGPGSNPPTIPLGTQDPNDPSVYSGTPQPIPAAYGGPGAAQPPAPPPAGGTGGGGPAPLGAGGASSFFGTPPTPTALPGIPNFAGSAPTFTAPSVADALADHGLQFREQQGEAALQNWAAAKGTLNDSGTAKALIDYGQASGQQGYADVWNRMFQQYQGNVNTWNTGTVQPGVTGYTTTSAAIQHANDMNYLNWWNRGVNAQNFAEWAATN